MLDEAKKLIAEEKKLAAEGKDPQDLVIDKQDLFKTLPATEDKSEEQNPVKMSSVAMAANLVQKKKKSFTENKNTQSKSCVIL